MRRRWPWGNAIPNAFPQGGRRSTTGREGEAQDRGNHCDCTGNWSLSPGQTGTSPGRKAETFQPPIPGANIEKAYQDRYALAPRSGAGSPPVQWYNLRPLFTYADLGINTYPEPRPN
jgi:hypothetical protein